MRFQHGVNPCCQRATPGSGDSPCSTKTRHPPGLRTRRVSLSAAAGISMAAVLRRRTGGSDLLELAPVGPRPAGGVDPGEEEPAGGADPGEQAPAEALSSAVAEAGNQEPAPELGEEG